MDIRISAISKAGEPVTDMAANERDALAMAMNWTQQGLTNIQVSDVAKTYTIEEYATKVINT